ERVGHGIEQSFSRDITFGGMKRGRELDVVYAKLACKCHPVFDRPIRITIAHVPRRKLLQGCRKHADLHELRLELCDGHGFRTPYQTSSVYDQPAKTRLSSLMAAAANFSSPRSP